MKRSGRRRGYGRSGGGIVIRQIATIRSAASLTMFAAFSVGELGGLLPLPRLGETVNRSWTTSPIYTRSECGRLLGSWGGRARYWACGATNTGRETCGKCYISRNGRAVVDLANFPLDWNPSHHLPHPHLAHTLVKASK